MYLEGPLIGQQRVRTIDLLLFPACREECSISLCRSGLSLPKGKEKEPNSPAVNQACIE
jgi:hypothetical protein